LFNFPVLFNAIPGIMEYGDATQTEIEEAIIRTRDAFHVYRNRSLKERAEFLYAIAEEIEALGQPLLEVASRETNLPEARLRSERTRTLFQLRSYADACRRGEWMEARIDTGDPVRNPPRPDLRKMMIPLGPVVVFGASNFPFAYSTAGGDTACAFAAGCTVIVKAHPAHSKTSEMVAVAIRNAVKRSGLPEGVFAHIQGSAFETGKTLVTHSFVKAVAFTGSWQGGKALFDWANQRKEPIPVFAEMGSINPVFLLPGKLNKDAREAAKLYAGSITLGVGQFCTNPGLLIAMECDGLTEFIAALTEQIQSESSAKMLHQGIARAYAEKRKKALEQKGVQTIAVGETESESEEGLPTIASASADAFLNNPVLHHEVFGPYSLIIRCRDKMQMQQVIENLEGQLTATVMATETDLEKYYDIIDSIKNICGRFIYNGVPTGVEVCLSMHHGGPYPATTDSRFTSVGADGIKRFARPVCYQNWPDAELPDELKNANPLGIWRTVNNELTKEAVL
jgi:NADP-dependent aldehyde dehydrogenase